MRAHWIDRRGFALVITLISLLIVSIVLAALTHQALGDSRRARVGRLQLNAAQAARAGAVDEANRWTAGNDSIGIGGSRARSMTAGALQVNVRTIRTSPLHWLVTSEASDGDSASRTLSRAGTQLSYRLRLADLPLNAVLTTRDSVVVRGTARVSGRDTTLTTTGLCSGLGDVAAIAVPDTTRVCDGLCGASGARISGAPALLTEPIASLATRYATFGSETWAALVARATVILPPGGVVTPSPSLAGGSCDTTDQHNWGAPLSGGPCATRSPLIWASGDLEIQGGEGQGVLLVDGDVVFSQGARFHGVVIARDDLVMRAPLGGTLLGVALAGNARGPANDYPSIDGNSLLQFSRCSAEAALRRIAPLTPVFGRATLTMR